MCKKVLILSASFRKNSNSDALADAFAAGAESAGHQVEKISLAGKQIAFCRGCMACQKLGRCVLRDDANEITEKILGADVIVWATPIYYYEMSGQMKTMIDRANSLYARDYRFRSVYLLSAAADDDPATDERALHGLEGWVACFEKCRLAGKVFAGGVEEPGSIRNHPALAEAFEMGKSV